VFFDNVANCAIGAFFGGSCGPGSDPLSCIMSQCGSELLACFADRSTC
jgi:hypothetical protein